MIYAVRLYTVDVASLPVFAAAFRRGGLWTDIARLFPGHIHTDLLRNPSDSSKFLSIEFWSSVPALVAARRSPEARSFGCWLKRQTIECEGLGMFVFPPQPGTESTSGETECAIFPVKPPACESTDFADEVWS
jgi:Antibiotic biosynthesis monooxygenase